MNTVFIVVECEPYEGDIVLRVFAERGDALAYGESLVFEGAITEYDIYERVVH